MAKNILRAGDSVSTTLGLNMPLGEDRGSPWLKAEVSNVTRIQEGETYEKAVKRSRLDVQKRLDKQINWLIEQISKRKDS